MTQPPSARLPGTLQQLERLLQEPKAFVPQCQGYPGGRTAQRLPLPARTQIQPHCQKTNNRPENTTDSCLFSPPPTSPSLKHSRQC